MASYSEENPYCLLNSKQHFLVSVTIYKARHLKILNSDTFVMVSLSGKYKRTKTASRTENPYFNEYFAFELHCSEKVLLRKSLHFILYRSFIYTSLKSSLGEFTVDLRTVWNQKDHAVFKKWATFEPIGRAASSDLNRGYLLIDIAISSSLENPVPVVFSEFDFDDIESNRLLPYDSKNEPRRVRYCCNIFSGDFKISDEYVVCISFRGLSIRTKPSTYGKAYRWNERMSFFGTFPSMNQTLVIQLLTTSCCYRSVKSVKEIQFESISRNIEGFYQLPTFGPTMVYFYTGAQDSRYVGKILLSINTEELSALSMPAKKIQIDHIYEPMLDTKYWEEERFLIEFYLINVHRFSQPNTQHIMLYLTCAEMRSESLRLQMQNFESFSILNTTGEDAYPLHLSVKIQVPDYRHKYFITYATNILLEKLKQLIVLLEHLDAQRNQDMVVSKEFLVSLTSDVEMAFDSTLNMVSNSVHRKSTKWDQMRKMHAVQQLGQHKATVTTLKSQMFSEIDSDEVKRMQSELNHIKTSISQIGHDEQNGYPDVLLHLCRPSGQATVEAVCRFSMADYLLPPSPSHPAGSCTGKRLAILPRSISCNHSCPDHCGCIYAKLDYVMVIGTDAHEQIPQGASAFAPESPLTNGTIDRPAENHMKSWQLNCKVHVHQGRIYSGFDETELCNVKLTVSFENYHSSLIASTKTVSPCWNETMEFINVPYTDLKVQSSEQQQEQRCTIMCILQAEGKETTTIGIGWIESDIIDRTELVDELPSVESTNFSHLLRTTLRWVPFYKMGVRAAEVLLSSEVVKTPSSVSNHDSDDNVFVTPGLPQAIAPTMCLYQMEILFFGLRQLDFKMRPEEYKSLMKIMIGEIDLCSGVSGVYCGGSTNFPAEKITCTLHLPSNSHYWPLIVIKHLDYSDVNRNKSIGVAIINHSDVSIVYPSQRPAARSVNSTIVDLVVDNTNPLHASNVPYQLSDNLLTHLTKVVSVWQTPFQNLRNLKERTAPTQKSISTDEGTWWTSFYKSLVPEDCHKPMLKIYTTELEKDPKFNGFRDWSGSYPLYKIKNSKDLQRKKAMYGVLKCKITFTPIKEAPAQQAIDIENETSRIRDPVEVTVVVYVVQALNLTSRDIASESDAYIVLTYGKECVRDRAYYIPNQASPVFGRRFEMRGLLPRDQILHLSIYDRDFTSPDDLIGSTCIDIEDRFWSKHLPGFGLPKHYRSTGSNRWRHASKPSEMLVARCVQHGLGHPTIRGQSITVGGVDFEAETIDASVCVTEQLCLLALNRFEELPEGFPLTPEHVETRSLYHPKRAGIEQGKVQLWVEVYEPGQPHPQPLDITPQPPQPHELRVIVWNTADVVLNERNIFGTEMSDIYVKCWLQEFSKAQHTDVHYRSLTGEGNFNWRMIFPFRYSPADGMLVVRRKKAFYEQYDTELKFPPVLTVQVWDNDSFSADDFLGTVDLNLARLPPPAPTAEMCKLDRGLSLTGSGSRHSLLNLFHRRHVRGWFPVHGNQHVVSSGDKTGNRQRRNTLTLTGKIELELEILSKEDATQTPVGRGRESPQHLPDPLRPEVSFNWLQQPARTFNKLLWPRVRRSFVWVGVMLLLCLLAYGLVVNLPTVFMVRTLDQRKSSIGWSESRSSVSNG